MARHRAPDVASPLHGPSPPAGRPTGTGRPRHAAGPAVRPQTPERPGRHRGQVSPAESPGAAVRNGHHRAVPTLEFVGPLTVAEPAPVLVEVTPAPLAVPVPTAPAPVSPPEPAPTAGYPMAETVLWAGFAGLVSCGVVAGGQGPREEALWILGVGGGALTVAGLGLVGVRRLRRGRTGSGVPIS